MEFDEETLIGDYQELLQRQHKWCDDHIVEVYLPFEPPRLDENRFKNIIKDIMKIDKEIT